MLKISAAQNDRLTADSRSRVLARLERFLVDGHPAETGAMGPAALRQFVEQGIVAADARGVTHERDVGLFLVLGLLFGPDFAGTPEAPHIHYLLGLDADGRVRMQWIADHMMAAEARAA